MTLASANQLANMRGRRSPYETELGTPGKTVWFVDSARDETLRATISLDSDKTLLGGNSSIAVLLRRTELMEESVEVYAVLRGAEDDGPTDRPPFR